jgi:hypothetical protein
MTLSASSTTAIVGEKVLFTATLANEGCSGVGMPQYRLQINGGGPGPVLVPNPPEPVTHIYGIGPGHPDSAQFTLHVVGSGRVTVTASSSFEVHLGYPGPAYWAGDGAGPVAITVAPTDTEVMVLQQAAYSVGCWPDVVIEGATYRFDCIAAPGHSTAAKLQRFADESEARSHFDTERGDLAVQPFHCYPAYAWSHEEGPMPLRQQGHAWAANRWTVTARSFDDTHIPVAPAPMAVSEAIYEAAATNGLFPACETCYLPFASGGQ